MFGTTRAIPRLAVGLPQRDVHTALVRAAMCVVAVTLAVGVFSAAAWPRQSVPTALSAVTVPAPAAQELAYRFTYAPTGGTLIERSADGGLTWATSGTLFERVLQIERVGGGNGAVLARTSGDLWRSEDGGASWERLSNLPGAPLSLAAASAKLYLGVPSDGLFTSADGGRTWESAGGRMSSAGAGALAVSALAVSRADEQVIFAAATFSMATPQGVHYQQRVLVTDDGGQSWLELTPAPVDDDPIVALTPLVDAPLSVLAVCPHGAHTLSLPLDATETLAAIN